MPGTRPGMTEQSLCSDLILYLGEIRDRAGGGADFVEQLQAILAHFWSVVVDLDVLEERVHRRTQFRHRAHGSGEVFLGDGSARSRLHLTDRFRERLFLGEAIECGVRRAVIGFAVLLLLDAQDVGGALGAGDQVFAIVGVEEFSQRIDTANP